MTSPVPNPTSPLTAVSASARAALAQVAQTPFSQAGFDMLQQKVDEYVEDLVLESVRIMERKQAEGVSPIYVQQASDNLVASRKRRMFTLAGTLGGVLLGAGVSSYIEMIKSGSAGVSAVIAASGLSIVGTFLIALQFSKE